MTAEWRRVLAPHGSICVELGDTYSGSGGAGGDYAEGGMRANQPKFSQTANGSNPDEPNKTKDRSTGRWGQRIDTGGSGWPLAKSLCGIPHLYHLSLAYGRNLLTGEPSPAGQWRVRNVVAWCRPNPPVGALGDKFRPGTSYLTIACVSDKRYFDLDAVRTAHKSDDPAAGFAGRDKAANDANPTHGWGDRVGGQVNTIGAPPLDWWEIPTQPYAGSHYATWPSALCTRPILSMCPQRVCVTCGEPSRRETDTEYVRSGGGTIGKRRNLKEPDGRLNGTGQQGKPTMAAVVTTTGWTDCGHDAWRNGLVLDPFVGSGTTLAVATGHGRDAIGIDLDSRNVALVEERVGRMFLEVEDTTREPAA